MTDDPTFQVNANWVPAMCTKGTINETKVQPVDYCGYGVLFEKKRQSFVPESIQAPYGADHWNVYLCGMNDDDIENQAKHLIYLFEQGISMTANTTYARFWLDYDNAQWLDQWKEVPLNGTCRRIVICSCWGTKRAHAGEQILDPRYSTKLGGENR